MSTLATLGTLAYGPAGGPYVFPVEHETRGLRIEPIADSARRTLIANKYELHIWAMVAVAAGSTVDATVADLRNRLTRPCQVLTATGKGLGNIVVNGAGGRPDIAFGPFPRSFSVVKIHGNLAIEFEWVVEFTIMDCRSDQPWFNLMEFCYRVTYAIGADRLTRRTFSGHLRVPNNRVAVGSNQIIDSADRYWEKACPALLYGFRRETEERTPSEDRSRLDFTVVDVQMESAPPPGVMPDSWGFEQTMTNNTGGLGPTWTINFHGKYKMAPNFSPSLGYQYFVNAMIDRLDAIRESNIVPFKNPTFVPTNLVFREDAKNRSGEFSASWLTVIPRDEAVQAGLWRPLPDNEFRKWAQSMKAVNAPRGLTGEVFTASDDLLISLCDFGGTSLSPLTRLPAEGQTESEGFPCPGCPDVNASFVWWQNAGHWSFDQGTADHSPLPTKPLPAPQPRQSLTDFLPMSTAGQAASLDPNARPQQQQRVAPKIYVTLIGYSVRVCYPDVPPKLVSVGGNPVLPANREGVEFVASIVLPGVCSPFVITRWQQRYLVTGQPPSGSPGGGGGGGSGGGGSPPTSKGAGGFYVIAPGQGIQPGIIVPGN